MLQGSVVDVTDSPAESGSWFIRFYFTIKHATVAFKFLVFLFDCLKKIEAHWAFTDF